MDSNVIKEISGRGIPVPGNDIDTDRIIPARYLRAVTFEGMGEHAFEDDRIAGGHPFDDARYQGAKILIANANFGCGSSREHAPQALNRWGIEAIVSESFAEIFQGNCTAIGVPCVTASSEDVSMLMAKVDSDPSLVIDIDLTGCKITGSGIDIAVSMPEGMRKQFLDGLWDSTGMLVDGMDEARKTAERLPYISGF